MAGQWGHGPGSGPWLLLTECTVVGRAVDLNTVADDHQVGGHLCAFVRAHLDALPILIPRQILQVAHTLTCQVGSVSGRPAGGGHGIKAGAHLRDPSAPAFLQAPLPVHPTAPKKHKVDIRPPQRIQRQESSQKQCGKVRLNFPRSSGKSCWRKTSSTPPGKSASHAILTRQGGAPGAPPTKV